MPGLPRSLWPDYHMRVVRRRWAVSARSSSMQWKTLYKAKGMTKVRGAFPQEAGELGKGDTHEVEGPSP